MSLYIKVQNSYWTNRKTMRLKAKIGDDAYWIMPRLWSIAAEHQPDGDFSGYTSEEIAMLIGCDKYASSILQALKDVGFIEENGVLHDWHEHNSYHVSYANRAKLAAEARWNKTSNTEDKTRQEPSNALSNASSIESEFEQCWKAYPAKAGSKHVALKAYKQAKPKLEAVLAGIERYKKYVDHQHNNGFPELKYANGQTWFNQRRWESEYTCDGGKSQEELDLIARRMEI